MFPPPIDDPGLLPLLPGELSSVLAAENGFIRFGGGLHVRGACLTPDWHSLRHSWTGAGAFSRLYPVLAPSDVPFGQDCMGDQFILRGATVHRLSAEDGSLESLGISLNQFFRACAANPTEFLSAQPLLQLEAEGSSLSPGELILAYPPFCTKESGSGVRLSACPAEQVITFHARLAAKLASIPDGGALEITVEP